MKVSDFATRTVLLSGVARRGMVLGLAMLLPQAAYAQQPDIASDEAAPVENADDIVVTGTLIRGNVQTGSQTLSFSTADIQKVGANNVSELLKSIPQDANFGTRPQVGQFGQYQTVNRPTLRYLGGSSSGGSSTLVLVDGHRMSGMGILQTTPDVDAIAVSAIERVEVVTDGGSSLYGADAVGGVMNFITRKRFDGLEAKASYGFADDFWQWDASVTAGKAWSNGSAWISYNYAKNDALYGFDRDYVRNVDYTVAGQPSLDYTCNPPNVLAGNAYYTFNNGAFSPGATRCDIYRPRVIFPAGNRHSVFAAFNIDLTENISFDTRAYYFNRTQTGDNGPLAGNVILPSNNAFYRPTPGVQPASQTVYFSYEPVFGPNSLYKTSTEAWGFTNTLTARLGGEWQAKAFFNFGKSHAQIFNDKAGDGTALNQAVNAGQFDPYNLNNPINAPVLNAYRNRRSFSIGENRLINSRVVFDGPLFNLPGGPLRVAFGGEIMSEEYALQSGAAAVGNFASIPNREVDRLTKAVFGELSAPIFGADNRAGGFYALTLSASARYDSYSDFGGTFNPKLGLSWQPVEGWTLRGSWGKSFQAPSLSDMQEANPASLQVMNGVYFPAPGVPVLPGQIQILALGGGKDLKPQKATTWSFGTDLRPVDLPGFTASLTYYHIDFSDRLSAPPYYSSVLYSQYPDYFKLYTKPGGITDADIEKVIAGTTNYDAAAQALQNPGTVYAVIDGRNTNLSRVVTSGLDFAINYDHPTSFGSIFGGVSGTYILSVKEQANALAPLIDNTARVTTLRMQTSLGTSVGGFRGELTWQYTSGYEVIPTVSNVQQSQISSLNTFNLALRYDVGGDGFGEGLTFTANVDNLFDVNPPLYNGLVGSSAGYTGFTLGRLVQFGVRKRF